jgi:hypothetical protein
MNVLVVEDSNDALLVAEKLERFQTVDLSEQYKEKIVDICLGNTKMVVLLIQTFFKPRNKFDVF